MDDFKRSMTYPCPRSLDGSRAALRIRASGKLDDYEKKNVEIQNKLQNVEKIEKSNEHLAEDLKSVKTQIEELNERHVDLQYRS